MYRFSATAILLAGIGLASPVLATGNAGPGSIGIGRVASVEEIAGWDIAVRPDGKGLPVGRGGVANGEKPYEEKCAVCHGSFGESNDYHVLAGGRGTLATATPLRTVGSKWEYATTLFD